MTERIPTVSIGMPVYNGERYVAAAIESVLGQTVRDLELIISDNASTDGTEAICRRYAAADSRVRYVRQAENLGAAANFKACFDLARGPFFKWAAHDDLLEPDYLEACLAALDAMPEAVLAQSTVRVIDETGQTVRIDENDMQATLSPSVAARFQALSHQPKSWCWHARSCFESFALIRRDILQRTELIAPYSASDISLCVELGLIGPFAWVPRPLFLNRTHPTRFGRTALTDRGACWRWWCRPGAERVRLRDLCPTWQVQAAQFRHIGRHVPKWSTRLHCYALFLRRLLSRPVLARMIIEPVTADARLHRMGRRVRALLQGRGAAAADGGSLKS